MDLDALKLAKANADAMRTALDLIRKQGEIMATHTKALEVLAPTLKSFNQRIAKLERGMTVGDEADVLLKRRHVCADAIHAMQTVNALATMAGISKHPEDIKARGDAYWDMHAKLYRLADLVDELDGVPLTYPDTHLRRVIHSLEGVCLMEEALDILRADGADIFLIAQAASKRVKAMLGMK